MRDDDRDRRRHGKRWAWRIAASLLVGCFLSILVAWAIAVFVRLPPFTPNTKATTDVGWRRSAPRTLGEPESVVVERHAGASHWQIYWPSHDESTHKDDCVSNILRFGFPFRSMESVHVYKGPISTLDYHGPLLRGHLLVPRWVIGFLEWVYRSTGVDLPFSGYLPFIPVWKGLIVNSMLYGALSLAAWLGLKRWRRKRRVKRGLCMSCGYDVTSLVHCPECGTATGNDGDS